MVGCASITRTLQPARASVMAAASPFGPEPITNASADPARCGWRESDAEDMRAGTGERAGMIFDETHAHGEEGVSINIRSSKSPSVDSEHRIGMQPGRPLGLTGVRRGTSAAPGGDDV